LIADSAHLIAIDANAHHELWDAVSPEELGGRYATQQDLCDLQCSLLLPARMPTVNALWMPIVYCAGVHSRLGAVLAVSPILDVREHARRLARSPLWDLWTSWQLRGVFYEGQPHTLQSRNLDHDSIRRTHSLEELDNSFSYREVDVDPALCLQSTHLSGATFGRCGTDAAHVR